MKPEITTDANAFFEYGEKETAYLKSRDKTLGAYIDRIGYVYKPADSDLFSAVVRHIIGQQISIKAQATIWGRVKTALGVDAPTIAAAGEEGLRAFGISYKKAGAICDFARKVLTGAFDLEGIEKLPDEQAIDALVGLKGVGVWTAEMILLFCLRRPDIFSYGDMGVLRGLRMVYRHREIDRERFEVYRRRFSPCCSVASLYLWAISGGAIPELDDPARSK